MTANTTNGLQYPTGGDAVGDLDTIVQTLAQALDDKLLKTWDQSNVTWAAASVNPNKGSTGVCNIRRRVRGHSIDFSLKLSLSGTGIALGTGNYSFTLPEVPADSDRWAFAAVTQSPNRQYFMRFTAGGNLVLYKSGGTGIYDAAAAATDGWGSGTILQAAGTYEV